MQICEVFDLCCGSARLRACGHVACDECSDEATNVCLKCVPIERVEYMQLMLLEEFRKEWPSIGAPRWASA
jgi:hypothetical protein